MKKNYLFLFLASIYIQSLRAQTNIGQSADAVSLPPIINNQAKVSLIKDLKGKVVWLEFWATWCSPCVAAMPHLQQLQKQYAGKLQVIAVSTEKQKRIQQFITNRPSNLWFVSDTADEFKKHFPYRTIPHAVLIDANGTVVAITDPQNITKQVIADVLAGNKIDLPLKQDNLTNDPWASFAIADTVTRRFSVQPDIKGLPSGSKGYHNDSTFKNRRISMLNVPLETIYRVAYGDLPYGRTLNLSNKEIAVEKKKKYCIDVVVPKGKEGMLLPVFQNELKNSFGLNVNIEKRLRPVYVLTISDAQKVKLLKPSSIKSEGYDGSGEGFKGTGVNFGLVANYLEEFGLVNLPVVNGTHNANSYDIAFSFMPEKKGDLEHVLSTLGLQLKKEEREIDMLVFR